MCKYALARKRLYFDLQPLKIDVCCIFLGYYIPCAYINTSALDVAAFRTPVVKGRLFFRSDCCRVTQLCDESDSL
jgi:hypothetical protein